ncbi:MAG TPA: phosphate ABC transporter permease subunit PstC [Galbitalea sp.]
MSATPADTPVQISNTANRPGAPKGSARTARTRSRPGDLVFKGLSTGAASLIMAILAGVALFLIIKALPAITANWTTNPQLTTGVTQGHSSFWSYVAPLIWGTVFVSAIGLLIGAPIAIGIALFISHYAPRRVAGVLSYIVDLLAAVPSIVFGLWGIFVIRPFLLPLTGWLNHHLGWIPFFSGQASATGSTVLAGAVVLAVMVIPIITAISREIFLQTPRLHEEAALAMGATKWEMIRLAVFPYARSGMVSAILLGLGRALGETMAIALIVSPSLIFSLKILTDGQNSQTVAANAALNFPDANDLQRDALIGTGLVLFIITFAVNLIARLIVARTGPGAKGAKAKRRIQQLPPSDPSSVLLADAEAGPLHLRTSEGS